MIEQISKLIPFRVLCQVLFVYLEYEDVIKFGDMNVYKHMTSFYAGSQWNKQMSDCLYMIRHFMFLRLNKTTNLSQKLDCTKIIQLEIYSHQLEFLNLEKVHTLKLWNNQYFEKKMQVQNLYLHQTCTNSNDEILKSICTKSIQKLKIKAFGIGIRRHTLSYAQKFINQCNALKQLSLKSVRLCDTNLTIKTLDKLKLKKCDYNVNQIRSLFCGTIKHLCIHSGILEANLLYNIPRLNLEYVKGIEYPEHEVWKTNMLESFYYRQVLKNQNVVHSVVFLAQHNHIQELSIEGSNIILGLRTKNFFNSLHMCTRLKKLILSRIQLNFVPQSIAPLSLVHFEIKHCNCKNMVQILNTLFDPVKHTNLRIIALYEKDVNVKSTFQFENTLLNVQNWLTSYQKHGNFTNVQLLNNIENWKEKTKVPPGINGSLLRLH